MDDESSGSPPLTKDDLYGPSSTPVPAPGKEKPEEPDDAPHPDEAFAETPQEHLVYEETPIIQPIESSGGTDPVPDAKDTTAASDKPNGFQDTAPSGRKGCVPVVLIAILMFGAGIWLAVTMRDTIIRLTEEPPPKTVSVAPSAESTQDADAAEEEPSAAQTTPVPEMADDTGWTVYRILDAAGSGTPFAVSLPEETKLPVCDAGSCPSYGTYLPSGTRLTLAYHPSGYELTPGQDLIIRDSSGSVFQTSQSTVGGRYAVEFLGAFTGRTTGGYRFTRMYGYMIDLGDGKTLEISHFAPLGMDGDFEADEVVFRGIVNSLVSD